MKLCDVKYAAINLAAYLARTGDKADMAIVAAQVKLIVDRTEEVQRERTEGMVAR